MSFSGFRSVRPSLLFLVLAAAAIGAGCQSAEPAASASTPAPEHRIDVPALTVGVADLESTLQISGNLVPQTRVAVMAKLPGTLSRVAVDIGDRVRVGQVVAALDRREIDAQVDAATASVNVARAGVGVGRSGARQRRARARARAEPLREGRRAAAAARRRRDVAALGERPARARHGHAGTGGGGAAARARSAARRHPHLADRRRRRRAQLRRRQPGGSWRDKPVVVVADLRVMKLEAGVSELEAGRLRVGMPARVSVQARPGEIVRGTARGHRAGSRRHATVTSRSRCAPPTPARCSRACTASATIPLERATASWPCRATPSPRAAASASRSGSKAARLPRHRVGGTRERHARADRQRLEGGGHDRVRRAARGVAGAKVNACSRSSGRGQTVGEWPMG